MSGVVKIEISESVETLKKLLINARTPTEKERIQTIYGSIPFWQVYKTTNDNTRASRHN